MNNFKKALTMIFVVSTTVCIPLNGQTDGQIRAIVALAGAASEEELDEQEIDRYLHYISHPLEINLSGSSRLISSGLLSRYQVASLEDYRSRYGDVLSFAELASVEGFGQDFVSILKPFISLRSRGIPGSLPDDTLRLRQDILAKAAVRGEEYCYGVKYKSSLGERVELSMAGRSSYSDKKQFPPSSWSANVAYYGKKCPWKLVAGDYNLRFGQGLALWSGLSLTGFSSSSSFSRRPSGLSPSYSWSSVGTHRGVAGDYQAGRCMITSFLLFPGSGNHLGGGNVGYYGKTGQVSLTAFGGNGNGKIAADFRLNHKGKDYFGESSFDFAGNAVAAVFGTVMPLPDDWRMNVVLREYPSSYSVEYSGGVRSWSRPSGEKGAAVGLERHGLTATLDIASKDARKKQEQCKLFLNIPIQVAPCVVLSARMTERIRPREAHLKYRTGARMDLDWSGAGLSARYGEPEGDAWKGRFRIEGLLCRSLAGLSYAEFGRKTDKYTAYLRGTVFVVDNWDDRIYSYERDAPGNYTVPAYYGRGYSVSAVGGGRFRFGERKAKTLKVYFRVSAIRYPFMDEPKPGRTEAKLQVMASL